MTHNWFMGIALDTELRNWAIYNALQSFSVPPLKMTNTWSVCLNTGWWIHVWLRAASNHLRLKRLPNNRNGIMTRCHDCLYIMCNIFPGIHIQFLNNAQNLTFKVWQQSEGSLWHFDRETRENTSDIVFSIRSMSSSTQLISSSD